MATTATQALDELLDRVRARLPEHADVSQRRNSLAAAISELGLDADQAAAYADGRDVLGEAYERLLTGAERRNAGQFQTPFWAADLMAGWLALEPTRLLLDPGVGAGRLLFRAGERAGGPDRLLGLDSDPLAIKLAARNLAWRGLADRVELRVADFLLDALPEAGTIDAATVNPPYSRHHALPAAVKAAIHDGFHARLGTRFSRLAALHALFLVRTLEVLTPGGRLAFITPSDWLDTNYGRSIRTHVLSRAHVEGLVLFAPEALPFGPGVLSSAAITLMRKGAPTRPTRVVSLPTELPPVIAVLEALTVKASRRRVAPRITVEDVNLGKVSRWSRPKPTSPGPRKGVTLRELARVRRGIATGNNGFFVLSEAERRSRRIPHDVLLPCATGPKAVSGLALTNADLDALGDDARRWVLNDRRPEAETEPTALGTYLRAGRRQGVHRGYLASRRTPWYALERREQTPILWSYFVRANPRFVRNHAGAVPLNTWLAVEPLDGVDPDELCAALNCPETLAGLMATRRNYAGMSKLEPAELSAIRVPGFRR